MTRVRRTRKDSGTAAREDAGIEGAQMNIGQGLDSLLLIEWSIASTTTFSNESCLVRRPLRTLRVHEARAGALVAARGLFAECGCPDGVELSRGLEPARPPLSRLLRPAGVPAALGRRVHAHVYRPSAKSTSTLSWLRPSRAPLSDPASTRRGPAEGTHSVARST